MSSLKIVLRRTDNQGGRLLISAMRGYARTTDRAVFLSPPYYDKRGPPRRQGPGKNAPPPAERSAGAPFTMPRFFVCSAVQKAAATQRKRLLPQAFCRHSIQHEGTPAPSYSPCETERFFSKQRFFDKLRNGMAHWAMPFLNEYPIAGFPGPFPKGIRPPWRRGTGRSRSDRGCRSSWGRRWWRWCRG